MSQFPPVGILFHKELKESFPDDLRYCLSVIADNYSQGRKVLKEQC